MRSSTTQRDGGAEILLVGADEHIQEQLQQILRSRYEVLVTTAGREALASAAAEQPDLVILDSSIPDLDQLEVVRQLRSKLAVPILLISGAVSESKVAEALDAGAQDYVVKPFSPKSVLRRVRALLQAGWPVSTKVLNVQDLELDLQGWKVHRAGKELKLTRTEFEILAYFAQHAGRLVTPKMVLENAANLDWGATARTVRLHIANIRKKIEPIPSEPRYILTERHAGYRLSVDDGAAEGAA